MLIKYRETVVSLLNDLIIFVIMYGFVGILMNMLDDNPAGLAWLALMVAPYTVFFFARRAIRHFVLLFPVYLILPGVLWFVVPEVFPRIMWMVVAGIFAVPSVVRFFKPKSEEAGSPWLVHIIAVLFVILSFVSANEGFYTLSALYPLLAAVVLVGRLLLLRMMQTDRSLEAISLYSKQPVKRIIAFDYKLLVGLAVIIPAMALVFHFAVIGPAVQFVAGIEIGHSPTGRDLDDLAGGEELVVQEDIDFAALEGVADEANPMFEALGTVLIVLVIIVVLVGVVLIIVALSRAFMGLLAYRSTKKSDSASDELDMYEDEREFVLPPGMSLRDRIMGFFKQENKIRKQFRETVARQIKRGAAVTNTDTPLEMTKTIKTSGFETLANEYNIVRYKEML